MNRVIILLAVAVTTGFTSVAAEIRLSLLQNESVLNETADLLHANGCSSESVEAFKKAVRFHKTDRFDTTKFPKQEAGFYAFKSVAELNRAIPDTFCTQEAMKFMTNHAPVTDLNHTSLACLDVVVLLIKDTGAKAPQLREGFADKHFAEPEPITNSYPADFKIHHIASPDFYKDGRTLLYPTNGYTYITGLTRSTNEIDLAVSLNGQRSLAGDFSGTDAAAKKLFSEWTKLRARDGLQFPKKLQVVSCGHIVMNHHFWDIEHVAVCFEHKGKLIYVEKNGACGPFMRADFNNEAELAEFAAAKLLPDARDPHKITFGTPVFVAINNRLIHIARP